MKIVLIYYDNSKLDNAIERVKCVVHLSVYRGSFGH